MYWQKDQESKYIWKIPTNQTTYKMVGGKKYEQTSEAEIKCRDAQLLVIKEVKQDTNSQSY